MLVLSRRINESIVIGDNVEVKVLSVNGRNVTLGFTAPREVIVMRKELLTRGVKA